MKIHPIQNKLVLCTEYRILLNSYFCINGLLLQWLITHVTSGREVIHAVDCIFENREFVTGENQNVFLAAELDTIF
jgi:hypothetical protein